MAIARAVFRVYLLRVLALWGCVTLPVYALPGPDDCVATVRLTQSTPSIVHVPNGTVCFECVFGGVTATDAMFQIDNSNIDPSEATVTVVNGTLVVFDSGAVFNTDSPINVRCNNTNEVLVLIRIFRPPVIRGNTTVDEGDTLRLDCDSSNSAPLPTVHWFSPDGEMISDDRELMISNITADMAGTYTCIATSVNTRATMDATVNIIVNAVDCGPLNFTDDDITVNVTSTSMGSIAAYQCRNGSSEVYIAQCTREGVWEPYPINCSLPVECDALHSTDEIIVNISSTTIGSIATYQCTNGSDMITTHCTIEGVWEPYPNATTDCSMQPAVTDDFMLLIALAAAIALLSCLLCVAAVLIAIIVCKKNSKHRGRSQEIGKCDLEKQTASGFSFIHSRHDPLMVELEQIIRVNGQYSSVQSTEFNVQNPSQQTEMASTATTEKSVDRHCQTELGQTAVVQTEPEQKPDISALHSVVHKPSKKPVPKNKPEQTPEISALYSVVHKPSKKPVPKDEGGTPTQKPTQNLLYVEVRKSVSPSPCSPQPLIGGDRVQYSTILHNVTPPPPPPDPDAKVGLDQILIQLKDIESDWRSLGVAVGAERLDEIAEFVSSDSGAMVEVVDSWLSQLYPKKPTWNEIADAVESIGHKNLADSIRDVYNTGKLPREVTNAVPDSLKAQETAPPPPLPPRTPTNDRDSPPVDKPPPLPAKPHIN